MPWIGQLKCRGVLASVCNSSEDFWSISLSLNRTVRTGCSPLWLHILFHVINLELCSVWNTDCPKNYASFKEKTWLCSLSTGTWRRIEWWGWKATYVTIRYDNVVFPSMYRERWTLWYSFGGRLCIRNKDKRMLAVHSVLLCRVYWLSFFVYLFLFFLTFDNWSNGLKRGQRIFYLLSNAKVRNLQIISWCLEQGC
jgi:hypothetical protein